MNARASASVAGFLLATTSSFVFVISPWMTPCRFPLWSSTGLCLLVLRVNDPCAWPRRSSLTRRYADLGLGLGLWPGLGGLGINCFADLLKNGSAFSASARRLLSRRLLLLFQLAEPFIQLLNSALQLADAAALVEHRLHIHRRKPLLARRQEKAESPLS